MKANLSDFMIEVTKQILILKKKVERLEEKVGSSETDSPYDKKDETLLINIIERENEDN